MWGSDTVCSLGAQFFPSLADSDLKVELSEGPAFLRDEPTPLRELPAAHHKDMGLEHQHP
ncbi:hypothetical protein DT019_27360 [Streptomyces sp. SDr-06]|nr:hypothetical protein DT019_27360 [Streptomyces sp. SDr-06]